MISTLVEVSSSSHHHQKQHQQSSRMAPETTIQSEETLKDILKNARSDDENLVKLTIFQLPNLILQSLKQKDHLLNQILLVIYNLHVKDSENYETLNETNRILVLRLLLRSFTDTIDECDRSQLDALVRIIDFVNSSGLLVELAYVLHACSGKLKHPEQDSELVDAGLASIKEKAAANLHLEALLMIHSITAIKSRQ